MDSAGTEHAIEGSNVHGRGPLAGVRYDVTLRVFLADDGMGRPHHSNGHARRWALNDALRERGAYPGASGSSCELGPSLDVSFHAVRAPSQIDAMRDALEAVALALDEAEMRQRGDCSVWSRPSAPRS